MNNRRKENKDYLTHDAFIEGLSNDDIFEDNDAFIEEDINGKRFIIRKRLFSLIFHIGSIVFLIIF